MTPQTSSVPGKAAGMAVDAGFDGEAGEEGEGGEWWDFAQVQREVKEEV